MSVSAATSSPTPRQVFERLLAGVTGRRWDELPSLYAEDTVVDHPLAIPAPTRINGREGIRLVDTIPLLLDHPLLRLRVVVRAGSAATAHELGRGLRGGSATATAAATATAGRRRRRSASGCLLRSEQHRREQ